ncbi:MAG: dihydroorotase [Desulfovibrionaceae bacterium]
MKRNFLIKNALYKTEYISLIVKDGSIVKILPATESITDISSIESVFDAKGYYIFPSFLDVHTHTRDPGFAHKETIESALTAALHGGFSGIFCMANTSPVNDTPIVTKYMLNKAHDIYPYGPSLYPLGAPTIGLKGQEMAPMAALKDAGCIAFSNDGAPVLSSHMLRSCMEYAHSIGGMLIEHCEDSTFGGLRSMNEGEMSTLLGLNGDPDISESIHVARAILLSDYLQIPIHIAHVSSHRSVELLAMAKQKGTLVSSETCPHYLFLDDSHTAGYNTLAKVNPPLRTPKDVLALRQALKDGVIDMLATDHAPHTEHEKNQPFESAPFGISGLDTALSLSWRLIQEDILSIEDIIRLWVIHPHQRFSLQYNDFSIGAPASFFIFNPHIEWAISKETMYSNGKNTPFLGQTLFGRVTDHWIKGHKVL